MRGLNRIELRTSRLWCDHIEWTLSMFPQFVIDCYTPSDYQPSLLSSPGRVAQSVTCLVTDAKLTDAKLTADPGVASLIPARSHTFVDIDHEIISTVILLPSAESFMKGCCQFQAKVCARLLVNCLFKLAQEKSVVRWTDRPAMTVAVDLGRKATQQTKHYFLRVQQFRNVIWHSNFSLHSIVQKHWLSIAMSSWVLQCFTDYFLSSSASKRKIKWAVAWDFQQCGMCDKQRLRPACAYAQTDQSLC